MNNMLESVFYDLMENVKDNFSNRIGMTIYSTCGLSKLIKLVIVP